MVRRVATCGRAVLVYPACAARAGVYVIGAGVHIYVCGQKNNLNSTLAIDSHFQTLIVGLLVEFID